MDTGTYTSRQIRWYENIFIDNIVTSYISCLKSFRKLENMINTLALDTFNIFFLFLNHGFAPLMLINAF